MVVGVNVLELLHDVKLVIEVTVHVKTFCSNKSSVVSYILASYRDFHNVEVNPDTLSYWDSPHFKHCTPFLHNGCFQPVRCCNCPTTHGTLWSRCSMLLLFCYHRDPRVISEVLELYVEGGRVSHSWCSWSWIWRVWWEQGVWWRMVCMRYKAREAGRMSGDAGALPERKVINW